MHFLKCNKCGHYNEVKTEYQMLCSNCNKKLENNFHDWASKNSDKTFDDFKVLVCTTNVEENVKTKTSKARGLKYWIGFTVAFAIFAVIGDFAGNAIIGLFKEPAYEKVLVEVANQMNMSCPMMIDRETRLDNTIALPHNVFQYNYTLVNMVKDSMNIDNVKQYLEPKIVNFVRTTPEMKTLRDNKTTINYYYRDKAGVYLLTITVKPDQYE